MKALFALIVAAVLVAVAGCASAPKPEPLIMTKEVRVPVPVSCKPALTKPDFPDTDAAVASTSDLFDLAKLYRAGRALRIAWEAQLEAALKGCSGE